MRNPLIFLVLAGALAIVSVALGVLGLYVWRKRMVEGFENDWTQDVKALITRYALDDRTYCGGEFTCFELCDKNPLIRSDYYPNIFNVSNTWYIRVPGGRAEIGNNIVGEPQSLRNMYSRANLYKPGTNTPLTTYWNKTEDALKRCPIVADLTAEKPNDIQRADKYERASEYFKSLMRVYAPANIDKQITMQTIYDKTLELETGKTFKICRNASRLVTLYWVDQTPTTIPEHATSDYDHLDIKRKFMRVDVIRQRTLQNTKKLPMNVLFVRETENRFGQYASMMAFWNKYGEAPNRPSMIYRLYNTTKNDLRRFTIAWQSVCLQSVANTNGQDQDVDWNACFAFVPVPGKKHVYNIILPFNYTESVFNSLTMLSEDDPRLSFRNMGSTMDEWEVTLE